MVSTVTGMFGPLTNGEYCTSGMFGTWTIWPMVDVDPLDQNVCWREINTVQDSGLTCAKTHKFEDRPPPPNDPT